MTRSLRITGFSANSRLFALLVGLGLVTISSGALAQSGGASPAARVAASLPAALAVAPARAVVRPRVAPEAARPPAAPAVARHRAAPAVARVVARAVASSSRNIRGAWPLSPKAACSEAAT